MKAYIENIVTKGETACFEQFLIYSHNVFKSHLLQMCQKASVFGEGLMLTHLYITDKLETLKYNWLSRNNNLQSINSFLDFSFLVLICKELR